MSKKDFNENGITPDLLERLKAARAADPNWEKAIKACAKAEAALNPKDDPAEGKVVIRTGVPKRNR
ncbi:MAG: hypothetical protein Q8K65_03165 [Alphaproteobacteria bacterium]|nr:hypothetical protein [Alphaproteobacteria bacterium]